MCLSDQVGLSVPYEHFGPLSYQDHCVYEVAIQMVMHSRMLGCRSKDNSQFDTVHQLRTTHTNQVRASPQSNRSTLAMGDAARGNYQRLGKIHVVLFGFRFNIGLKNRIGQNWRPNRALLIKLLLILLEKADERIDNINISGEMHKWIMFSTYTVVCYVVSLRGVEGFLLDLAGLFRYWNEEKKE